MSRFSQSAAKAAIEATAFFCLISCGSSTSMTEFPRTFCPLTNAPIILVGRVLYAPLSIGEPHRSQFDGRPLQLFRVGVEAENVFRGDVSKGPQEIFFFMNTDSSGGNGRLADMVAGERDVFLLVQDFGKYRIVCDGRRACVPKVMSGAHPDFLPGVGKTIGESLIDLMLSRGVGATDQQMIDSLDTSFDFAGENYYHDEHYIRRLKMIVKTETPAVSEAACNVLKELHKSCGENE